MLVSTLFESCVTTTSIDMVVSRKRVKNLFWMNYNSFNGLKGYFQSLLRGFFT